MLILNKTKWSIVKELSKGNKTPTELAKKLKMTLPSIHAQLKGLEQERLIKKVGEVKGKTRPYAEYSIGEGFVYFIKALPNETEQKFLEVDDDLKIHLNVWSIPQREYHIYVERFLFVLLGGEMWHSLENKYWENVDAIVVYGSVASGKAEEGSDIDILLLVKKNVEKYEKEFGAVRIEVKGKGKTIMTQVFRTDDFENSLKKGSDFAIEVIKNNVVIYDPDKKFTKLKNGP